MKSNEQFDQVSCRPVASVLRRSMISIMIAFVLGIVLSVVVVGSALPAMADTISCSCVLWVRQQTKLAGGPANAAGYTESVMWSKGYRRINGPQARAIIIWDPNVKGAGSDGHMGIVLSNSYDYGRHQWVVNIEHANWNYKCGIYTTPFHWNDLNGVKFYVPR